VEFEGALAGYLGVKHAISVRSGTAALHLSVLALGLSEGDEVIVPDFSVRARAKAVAVAGAKPCALRRSLGHVQYRCCRVQRLLLGKVGPRA
jgi:dTDP-4-amino-4,6-dideoxygalactose transaminase